MQGGPECGLPPGQGSLRWPQCLRRELVLTSAALHSCGPPQPRACCVTPSPPEVHQHHSVNPSFVTAIAKARSCCGCRYINITIVETNTAFEEQQSVASSSGARAVGAALRAPWGLAVGLPHGLGWGAAPGKQRQWAGQFSSGSIGNVWCNLGGSRRKCWNASAAQPHVVHGAAHSQAAAMPQGMDAHGLAKHADCTRQSRPRASSSCKQPPPPTPQLPTPPLTLTVRASRKQRLQEALEECITTIVRTGGCEGGEQAQLRNGLWGRGRATSSEQDFGTQESGGVS